MSATLSPRHSKNNSCSNPLQKETAISDTIADGRFFIELLVHTPDPFKRLVVFQRRTSRLMGYSCPMPISLIVCIWGANERLLCQLLFCSVDNLFLMFLVEIDKVIAIAGNPDQQVAVFIGVLLG